MNALIIGWPSHPPSILWDSGDPNSTRHAFMECILSTHLYAPSLQMPFEGRVKSEEERSRHLFMSAEHWHHKLFLCLMV